MGAGWLLHSTVAAFAGCMRERREGAKSLLTTTVCLSLTGFISIVSLQKFSYHMDEQGSIPCFTSHDEIPSCPSVSSHALTAAIVVSVLDEKLLYLQCES